MLEKELKELKEDTAADSFIRELTLKTGEPVTEMSDSQIREVISKWKTDPETQKTVEQYLTGGRKKELIELLTPEKYAFPAGSSVSISKSARYIHTNNYHEHDFFEIECVLDGQASHHSLFGNYALNTADIVLIPPHVRHDLDVIGNGTIVNLGIRSSTFRSEFNDMLKNDIGVSSYFEKIMYGTFNSEVIIRECLDEFMIELILMAYQNQKTSFDDKNRIGNHLITCFISRMFERSRPDLIYDITQSSEVRAGRIRKYIYEHADSVTLRELSDVFFMSPSYLSRYLKNTLHAGFSEIVREARIDKAKELLVKTDLSVLDISAKTGYSSQSHFIHVFHKATGISPLQYRIRRNNQNPVDDEEAVLP
ncbi:MAG: AraC family transcriptional regulator [Solobacterium sp.]|nr:AraC family transcriptional regulator [Solobacterium sp.]